MRQLDESQRKRRSDRLKSMLRQFKGLTGARTMLLLVVVPIAIIFITGCANSPAASSNGDPSGVGTGTRNDTVGATAGGPQVTTDSSGKISGNDLEKNKDKEPLAYLLADVVGQNRISVNFVWTLVTGFLVMCMQASFPPLATSSTRPTNA